jgi:hypothetical protein
VCADTRFFLLPAVLSSVAFAHELIGPAPTTSQWATASANGYIVVFAQGTSPTCALT